MSTFTSATRMGRSDGSGSRHSMKSSHSTHAPLSPRHKRPENDGNPQIIEQTRQYIRDFDRFVGTAATAQGLDDKMMSSDPNRVNQGWALWSSVLRS